MIDLRLAWRRLAASPMVFGAAVLTLALGMGVNALLFSATSGLLLKPLPFQDGDALAWLLTETAAKPGVRETTTGEEGEAVARSTSPYEATAAVGDSALVRELERSHQRWRGLWATTGLFQVLKIAPALGAVPPTLPPDGAPRAMVIGNARWQRDFGADPGIIGRELAFADNKRFVVVGVLPPALEFPFARPPHPGHGAGFLPGEQDYWILAPDPPGGHPGGVMIGRLGSGQDHPRAQAVLSAVSAQLAREHPASHAGRTLVNVPLRQQILGPLSRAVPLLQAFAVLVLAIACANLASLLIARGATRTDEVTVRLALGARLSDLVRLRAAEAFVISVLGAGAGLGIAWIGRAWLARLAPRHEALVGRITIDAGVVLALGGAAVLVTFACGVFPALWRRRSAMLPAHASRVTRSDVRRSLRTLVACQIALSVTLAASALLLGRSLQRLLDTDPGYRTEGVFAADAILYVPTREAQVVMGDLVTRLRAVPGVDAVGFVHSTPLTGKWIVRDTFEILDGPAQGRTRELPGSFVAHDYFRAMQIPIVAGRGFSEADLSRRDYPIIINDIAARQYFPGRSPIGERVRITGALREIVGVVGATRDLALDMPAEPQWYLPGLSGTSELVVRATAGLATMPAALRREIAATDPRFIVQRIDALDGIASDTVMERRLAARLAGIFAGLAIVVAGLGLYGVLSFSVAQRRREFAIRAAVGATRGAIARLLVGDGLRAGAIGIGVGMLAGAAAARELRPFLYETVNADLWAVPLAAALLLGVSLAASIGPALRGAATSVVTALRRE
jgi:predicted permease